MAGSAGLGRCWSGVSGQRQVIDLPSVIEAGEKALLSHRDEDQDAANHRRSETVHLEEELTLAADLVPESFSQFQRDLPAAWVDEALCATGTATVRRRRLPADQVVWLIIGMAMMRDRPITDVVDRLDLALPGNGNRQPIARSTVSQARAKLGDEPLEWLFLRSADAWGHASADRHRFGGLAVYGVDGTTLRVADSDENREHFGGQSAGDRGRGPSAYPLVRLAALMALRSHLLVDVSFGPFEHSEYVYATDLWPSVPDNSLTVLDRGFFSANVLIPLARDGHNRHWLIRAKKNNRWRLVRQLGPYDAIVEMQVSSEARRKNPALPKTWQVRVIQYQRKGYQPQLLLTSLLDSNAYPAEEMVRLYHERWEMELGYDEIKTELLNRQEALRSQTVKGVLQELWGIFLAYNLIRLEMERIAAEAKVDPIRISFVTALRYIRDEWFWLCGTRSPGAIPRHLRAMRDNIKRFILPVRRSDRLYPRAVKIKMSGYALNRRRQDVNGSS
jgi:hypothetical protein